MGAKVSEFLCKIGLALKPLYHGRKVRGHAGSAAKQLEGLAEGRLLAAQALYSREGSAGKVVCPGSAGWKSSVRWRLPPSPTVVTVDTCVRVRDVALTQRSAGWQRSSSVSPCGLLRHAARRSRNAEGELEIPS
jgi:hypothetical protein